MIGDASSCNYVFDQAKALFERHSVDRFRIKLPDVGNVAAVRVWTDGAGFGSDWHLDKISIENLTTLSRFEATFSCWIKGGEDKGPTRPALLMQGPPVPTPIPTIRKPASESPDVAHNQQDQSTPGSHAVTDANNASSKPPAARYQAPPRQVPGGPGISRQVLGVDEFVQLPAMQAGDPRFSLGREQASGGGALQEPPPCAWQRHTTPSPEDSSYNITYYHNPASQQSVYELPPEFAAWETAQDAWLASVMK